MFGTSVNKRLIAKLAWGLKGIFFNLNASVFFFTANNSFIAHRASPTQTPTVSAFNVNQGLRKSLEAHALC